MKTCLFLLFTFVFPYFSYAQELSNPSIEVGYIKEFTIKIDGRVAFYTYDTARLDTINYSNYILVISSKNVALMKFADKDRNFIFHSVTNNNSSKNTYSSTFRRKGYILKLNTRKIKEIGTHSYLYAGILTIKHGGEDAIIRVKGIVPVERNN